MTALEQHQRVPVFLYQTLLPMMETLVTLRFVVKSFLLLFTQMEISFK